MDYADVRAAEDRRAGLTGRRPRRARPGAPPGEVPGARPGEFAADELSVVLREQPYPVRCLVAQSRRLTAGLPSVWEAYRRGEVDPEQVRMVDRVARQVTLAATLATVDGLAVGAAQTRSPKQLKVWLLRLVAQLEPLAFAERHGRALADRRVTVVQGADGIGYLTAEMTATDAAEVDALLTATARSLGAADPRTQQQRRADLAVDLLLGRLRLTDPGEDENDGREDEGAVPNVAPAAVTNPEGSVDTQEPDGGWLEVEEVDPETGELQGTRWQAIDADGEPIGPTQPAPGTRGDLVPVALNRPQTVRIGIVVPLSSLLGLDETPAELADRSGLVPAEVLRQLVADSVNGALPRDHVLFTRLLTDDGGRLLDTTELGRYASARLAEAVALRAGTCRFPTCGVPANRCDLDHHDSWPTGPTSAGNLDPLCRRHHRGKTFAWQASIRDDTTVEWTLPDANRYRCRDDPLPTGLAA